MVEAEDAAAEEVAVAAEIRDRFGVSWRPELAAGVLLNRDRVDCIEVISDDYLDADSKRVRALATLARELPLTLHSIHLGLASTAPIEPRRVEKVARLIDKIRPEGWSEHLAFVRAAGIEIGHLAAPPRDAATVEGTLANLATAARITGLAPEIENIATLVDPPGSVMTEEAWLGELLARCSNSWLLDIHNVYANSLNFHFDPRAFLAALPLARVRTIHLAGGKWIEDRFNQRRYLDDHMHATPDPVYDLLSFVAERVEQPLDVILERDGAYPATGDWLAELDRARMAVATGRSRQRELAKV